MFTEVSFIISLNWKQLKYALTAEDKEIMVYSYNGILYCTKSEQLWQHQPFGMKCLSVILSGMNQTQKSTESSKISKINQL